MSGAMLCLVFLDNPRILAQQVLRFGYCTDSIVELNHTIKGVTTFYADDVMFEAWFEGQVL
jgi:hypothetical protein